ncbi:ATP-binding cassette domain-containing protein [Peptostreptococcus porci]|uniref:ATP-binding cassette domain-containing protein n=1 Tax=Peptostreptococcus porci TaxID=2652282 RepID=UPI0023F217A5|nr:ATP-binding cassette domain-containing protein [Peptostreptococcus porci]MDD7182658.1 ATP-binding cassette domain-containing protein [Peptostreptococcus porci]MDY5964845.1 ATP-binding cassette domain-containing protein [Peptostreptococcus porci]
MIIFKDISKSYGNKIVLKNFNIEIREGQTTFVLGKSGSGKTTFSKIVLGLEKIDTGEISGLDGKKISVVFQEDRLMENMTIGSNFKMTVNSHINSKQIIEKMEKIGLFQSLETKISELSGGMKRRISILRAFLIEFDLIVMDEPFRGLDDETKEIVMNFVIQNIKGKTAIIITHNKDEVEYFAEKIKELQICNMV